MSAGAPGLAALSSVFTTMVCLSGRAYWGMHWLTERPDWFNLRAVRAGHVYVTDGNSYFNRPGPRLVESAEMLAEMLYPGHVDYGHHINGWHPLSSPIH